MSDKKDYYELLGVSRNATEAELKKLVISPEFQSWLKESPVRERMLQEAHVSRDVAVATDLLDMFKATRQVATENAIEERDAIAKGDRKFVVIAGESGIGKTSLVASLRVPVIASHGIFVSGKFEQLKRRIPYTGIINAFNELIRHWLTLSHDEFNQLIEVCEAHTV